MILKHQQISHNTSFIFVYFSELFLKIGEQIVPRKKNSDLCRCMSFSHSRKFLLNQRHVRKPCLAP